MRATTHCPRSVQVALWHTLDFLQIDDTCAGDCETSDEDAVDEKLMRWKWASMWDELCSSPTVDHLIGEHPDEKTWNEEEEDGGDGSDLPESSMSEKGSE